MKTRINDKDAVKLQVLQGSTHGGSQPGSIHTLAFYTDASSILEQEQIQFGAIVGGPIVGFIRFD